MKWFVPMLLAGLCLGHRIMAASAADVERGRDLLPVFTRAHAGLPLRAAAMGGSITQAGAGWIEPWLRNRFPGAAVTMHNAGMSATGSQLGVFRLERDVISAQPDLVLLEFAVNDGGENDANAIRCVESIVVRLKSLPQPPAIVFVEAAAKGGSNRVRHQRVAAHYGLLDVDLQAAVDRQLAATRLGWDVLMSDDVHPSEAGHAFYARTLATSLEPFVVAAESRVAASAAAEAVALPPPLSTNPLLLDGRLVPLDPAPGWSGENALPFWWNRFFNGVISATTPGTCLRLPVRGTTVGLFYALDPGYGTFHVNLDGGTPEVVDCSVRGGYSYSMLGSDLPAAEHTVAIAVAKPVEKNGGPVKLGYLLVAGETHSTRAAAPQGTVDPAVSALIDFAPLAATEWEWSGPYGGAEKTTGPTADLETAFAPEVMPGPATSVAPEAAAAPVWRRGSGDGATLDFATLTTTGWSDRGVCYARTNVRRAAAGPAFLALRVDYFAKVWVNGAVVRVIAGGHGHPNTPILFPVEFKSGDNALLIKVHSGSRGNRFSLFVECEAQAR